jgi:hypothetical protein
VLVVEHDAVVQDVGGSLMISRFEHATSGGDPRRLRTYCEGVFEFVGVGAERVSSSGAGLVT